MSARKKAAKPEAPKNKGGRPTKMTPSTRQKILDGLARGLPRRHAAWAADVAPRTMQEWEAADAGFRAACEKASADGDRPVIAALRDRALVDGDLGAMIWICKARIPEMREPKDQPVHLSSPGDGLQGMLAMMTEMSRKVAAGEVAPSMLADMATVVERASAVIERADLEQRIAALEAKR